MRRIIFPLVNLVFLLTFTRIGCLATANTALFAHLDVVRKVPLLTSRVKAVSELSLARALRI